MLGSLRLGQLFNAALLKNNEETTALLKLVEPYVTWGYPNINTVRELIFKHGFLSIDSKKVAIDSNKLIEDHLGELGVICIEDIVHELFNVTDNFDKIKQFLLPFKVWFLMIYSKATDSVQLHFLLLPFFSLEHRKVAGNGRLVSVL